MNVFLETDRLLLRFAALEDAALLDDLDSDPEVIRYTDLSGYAPTPEFRREHILPRWLSLYAQTPSFGYWIAVEKATGDFLGWFHFRRAKSDPNNDFNEIELGYRLKKSAWGLGYATEGSLALIRKGFLEQNAQRVTATALAENSASLRVLEKAGLTFDTHWTYEFTDPETGQTTGYPAVKYALEKHDFRQ